ncbi:sugar phosphate nucleotidyltransferase [Pseudothioglobus sp. nBUS_23]|uniref:phosphocholine cytidylyltransferase family protein n=1 Tax=Pseudothioglobus sp. nBUS_23 TaxID=3395318 RepID=UPI003EB6EEC1
MKAIILAAGISARMGIKTYGVPKPLLKINGLSLIEHNVSKLSKFSEISEIIVVVGYKKELIINTLGHEYDGLKITYIFNSQYRETNSSFSMWLAKDYVMGGFIVMNGDTLIDERYLNEIINEDSDSSVLIDLFFTKFTFEDLKVSIDGDFKVNDIGKDILLTDKTYGSPAIYKFQNESVKLLFELIDENFIKKNSLKSLLSKAVQIFSSKYKVIAISIDESIFWIDIDTPSDYQDAINYYENNI